MAHVPHDKDEKYDDYKKDKSGYVQKNTPENLKEASNAKKAKDKK